MAFLAAVVVVLLLSSSVKILREYERAVVFDRNSTVVLPMPIDSAMWHSLVPIWTVILGLGVFIYVALDGFDLGVGMLHGLVAPAERDTVMSSIGPF